MEVHEESATPRATSREPQATRKALGNGPGCRPWFVGFKWPAANAIDFPQELAGPSRTY